MTTYAVIVTRSLILAGSRMQVDVPTIELVDLPGIQLYPTDLYEQTTNLVNSYLQEEDTLVLCVEDATIPSLDSSIAVKMVRDSAKLPSTILALTKADLVRDEESIVEHIFERGLNRSKEMAELPSLVGCVAVVNCLHQDKVSLVEAEAAEEAVFNELFEDPAEAYAAKTVQQQLRQNIRLQAFQVYLSSVAYGIVICTSTEMCTQHCCSRPCRYSDARCIGCTAMAAFCFTTTGCSALLLQTSQPKSIRLKSCGSLI